MLRLDPSVKVIVQSGQNDRAKACRAVELGAHDCLAKLLEADLLDMTVERDMRMYDLQAGNARLNMLGPSETLARLITRDSQRQRACLTIDKVAPSNATEAPLDPRIVRDAAARGAIVRARAHTNDNMVKAAELLGVSRPTHYDASLRPAIRVDR